MAIKVGWQKEKDNYIYYEADGTVLKGRQYRELPKINQDKQYYLTEDGKLLTGIQQWAGSYWCFNEDGTLHKQRDYVKSQWGDYYMVGENGQVLSGVQKWQGTYYYFYPNTYLLANKQDYVKSQWGTWYMVGKDGRLMTGLVDWQGSKYYFDPSTYMKVTNKDVVVDGVTYHADANGVLSQAQATKSYGGDYSKYQPSLYNNTGQDSFAISQIGGSINGYIYEQATYGSHAQQAKAKGWRFHTYIWMQTGSNQWQTQQMLNYFLPRLQQPKGAIVALDYEAGASDNIEANTDNILAGMRQIKSAGYTPMLYSYKPYMMSHVDVKRVLAEFPNSIWVAGYQTGLSVWPNYGYFPSMNGVAIWQYSDYGGQQDLNVDLTGITWNGYRTVDGWNGADDKWQYVENGQVVKNDWRKVDDRWYHFDETGYVQTGWQQINEHWYYFDTNHDGTFGAAKTGWNQINNRWYYMDKDNAWCLTGWQEIDGKKYYFNPENAWMLTGDQTIDGVEYVFADNGSLQGQKQQPVQPKTKPVEKSTLSDADRQAIENDLKPYIQEVVKQELANNGR